MFVRSRTYQLRGRDGETHHHTLVQAYRTDDGKPRQRTLASWRGPRDLHEAIALLEQWAQEHERERAFWQAKRPHAYQHRRAARGFKRFYIGDVDAHVAWHIAKRDDARRRADLLRKALREGVT